MLLAVDIGNSTAGFGLFPKLRSGRRLLVRKAPSRPVAAVAEYRSLIADLLRSVGLRGAFLSPNGEPIHAVVSSVVPLVEQAVLKAVREFVTSEALVVSSSVNTGLIFAVKRPEQVGADRIVNAVAAVHLCGCPVAVADLGTATTVTVVGRKNLFLGGAILPGLGLMQRSLRFGTAQLPDVGLRTPRAVLGNDTISSIRSGIMHGTAGAVERIVRGIEKAHHFKVNLVLTGGYARLISPILERDHLIRPTLAFEGLRVMYLKNRTDIQKDAIWQ